MAVADYEQACYCISKKASGILALLLGHLGCAFGCYESSRSNSIYFLALVAVHFQYCESRKEAVMNYSYDNIKTKVLTDNLLHIREAPSRCSEVL